MADENLHNENQTPPAGALAPDQELQELKAKCDEYLAGWQRAKADFANYRRDELARFDEIAKYASEDLMKELITVIDNFDLAIATLEKTGAVERGIYMIRTQLEDALKKRGLVKVSAEIGKPFDPSFEEAIAEAPSEHPEGTVIEEIEAGYKLHEKIVRPARVRISTGPQASNQSTT
jgi:molecular chaperone GrpE